TTYHKGAPMDFDIDDRMQGFIDAAAAVSEELAPGYQQREKDLVIDPELRKHMGAQGLIAPEIPEELGGRGERALTAGMITEQISRGDINVGYVQVVGSLVGQILARNAHPEVAKTWVPR